MLRNNLQSIIDLKTKPPGSLGLLEKIALQIGLIQKTNKPKLKKPTIIVFAGDHGIAKEGVSNYPQEVTYQMVLNFLNGGAAINIFSKENRINLKIVDAGVNFDFKKNNKLIISKIGNGTNNFLNEKAMTKVQYELCMKKGGDIIEKIYNSGCNVIGFGEMGIGNTSSATMIMSNLCNIPIEKCTGRGTGLNKIKLKRKIEILKKAQAFHGKKNDPALILRIYGGFEIAQMCGAMLSAYEKNMLILIDGFIASSAFLVAYKIKSGIIGNALFCHQSDENGHKTLLKFLKAEPILKLNMRLGEGTGCALAYPIIKNAVAFLNDMASFESARVSNKK